MENNRDSTNGYGSTQAGTGIGGSTGAGAGIGGTAGSYGAGSTYDTGAAQGASGTYGGASTRGGGGMSAEMRNLIADVEDLLKGVANVGDADVARLRARVTETVASAKESLLEGTENLRVRANDAATTADSYVRERPWAAIGIAAAVGVALGLMVSRRGGDDY